MTTNQIDCQCRQPFILIFGKAIFDRYILTLDISCLIQALSERRQQFRQICGCPAVEKSDHWHRSLLCLRCERPGRRNCNSFDKIAASHCLPEAQDHACYHYSRDLQPAKWGWRAHGDNLELPEVCFG